MTTAAGWPGFLGAQHRVRSQRTGSIMPIRGHSGIKYPGWPSWMSMLDGEREAEPGEQAGVAEYHNPADACGRRVEHDDGVGAVDTVATAKVGGSGRLPVGEGRDHAPVAGRSKARDGAGDRLT